MAPAPLASLFFGMPQQQVSRRFQNALGVLFEQEAFSAEPSDRRGQPGHHQPVLAELSKPDLPNSYGLFIKLVLLILHLSRFFGMGEVVFFSFHRR
ncbi:MAG: hypothetical protein ACYTBZ_16225 [Planctomycetota bacterium]|jgi:hypothetical protein